MIEVLPTEISIDAVDIWFQDEARVGQRGTLTRTWAAKGTRPRLIRQQQFEYAYIFGAVCPALDKAVGLILPVANTDAMLVHLEHISAEIPEGRHAILILDQASWHTTKRLRKFNNLTLLSLPPASPELNPTEQVWQVLRDTYLANRCYEDYEDIVRCCCNAWNGWVGIPGNIRTLCSRSWADL